MANVSISRLISSNFRGHYPLIKCAAWVNNVEIKPVKPSWSLSLEEIRLSANHVSAASNAVCTPNTQVGVGCPQLGKVAASHHQNNSPHRGLEALGSLGLLVTRPSFDLLAGVTASLQLLSVEDRAVRLPSFEKKSPVETPNSTLINPQELPNMPGSISSTIVEPYKDLLPRMLPSAHESAAMECINMVRLRRKKMKKHKRKKEYKRNRVSHEHRILMDIIRKEKLFMLEQTSLLNDAEQFSAEQYVANKIKTYRRPVPKFWKGKKLPESVVIDLMRKDGIPVPGFDD